MEKRLVVEKNIVRIAITGPESTGKTQLAQNLAKHYGVPWVEEYAREYLSGLQRTYTFEDVRTIAVEQWNRILKHSTQSFIADTELLVTAIWQDVVFSKVDSWIESHICDQPFDIYLLCSPDIPWEYDPLREHPDRRTELFNQYLSMLQTLKLPFSIVSGKGEERFISAIDAINSR